MCVDRHRLPRVLALRGVDDDDDNCDDCDDDNDDDHDDDYCYYCYYMRSPSLDLRHYYGCGRNAKGTQRNEKRK
jgi:hypothetical protein